MRAAGCVQAHEIWLSLTAATQSIQISKDRALLLGFVAL